MLTDNLEGEYDALLVAPKGLKPSLCDLIQAEIDKGSDGYICIKANSVTERDIIDKLQEASQAGVQVEMIIRGICCIRPGVLLKTEHIQVTSIVGRYLEHARIYVFGKGDQVKYFIASADLMTRNLQRRVEIACPIWDKEIQGQLQTILDTQLRDNAKASFLQPSGAYLRKEPQNGQPRLDCQEVFMETSLHHPGAPRPGPEGPGEGLLFPATARPLRGELTISFSCFQFPNGGGQRPARAGLCLFVGEEGRWFRRPWRRGALRRGAGGPSLR